MKPDEFVGRPQSELWRVWHDPTCAEAVRNAAQAEWQRQVREGAAKRQPKPEELHSNGDMTLTQLQVAYDDPGPRVVITKASDIRPEPVRWLWPAWLAGGKLQIIAGAPSNGKTTLALAFAAILSNGGVWPDGSRCEAGDVLIWSGEDGDADTLIPRLKAMDADLSRVHIIRGIQDDDGPRPFEPSADIAALATAAARIPNLKLLIVDPIVSAILGDSHKNAETRRSLQPLVDFGRNHGATVLGISHFSKGTKGRDPLERLTGSLAFGALARIVFGTARDLESEHDNRIFVRLKSNLGPDGGGFTYRLEVVDFEDGTTGTKIVWGDVIEGDARDILGGAEADSMDTEERTARDEAADWLRDVLSTGSVRVKDIKKEATEAGYSWRTVERAKVSIGAKFRREGFGKECRWELPIFATDPHSRQSRQPQNVGEYGEYDEIESPKAVSREEF